LFHGHVTEVNSDITDKHGHFSATVIMASKGDSGMTDKDFIEIVQEQQKMLETRRR